MTQETIKTDQALEALVERIRKGQCVLFLGAGINIQSTHPKFDYPEEHRPLQAGRLANELITATQYKEILPDASDDDLPKAALFVETTFGRHHLINALKKHLGEGKRPSHALRMLACMPFSVYITTNYDDLLEQALAFAQKKPNKLVYDPVFDHRTPFVQEGTPENPLVFKMHGDLDQPASIVITDDDYINFIQKMSQHDQFYPVPLLLRAKLAQWPTLFIGYRLQDYNLRLLFRTLRWRLDAAEVLMSYSVDLKPDPLILSVWQDKHQIISFFKYDLWHFIPWLYERVCGKDYQP